MTTRLEWARASPDAYVAMFGLEKALAKVGLGRPLIELVYLCTSQVNDCAYRANTHTNDTCKAGKAEQHLRVLCVQQETLYFTLREHAVLAWTEQLARLSQGPLPHGLLNKLREHFDGKETAELTLTVSAINAWNRFGVGMDMQPE